MSRPQPASSGSPRVGPATLVATCLGLGFFPFAPATFTSLILTLLLWGVGHAPLGWRLAALLVTAAAGTWAAGHAERRYGHDARCIVIDEVAGMFLATLLVPWDARHLGAAFILFRVFDVLKPPPAYQLQSLPAGWGVVADDLAAVLYALLVLALAGAVFPFL